MKGIGKTHGANVISECIERTPPADAKAAAEQCEFQAMRCMGCDTEMIGVGGGGGTRGLDILIFLVGFSGVKTKKPPFEMHTHPNRALCRRI
jgi:hypothetical protein